MGSENRPRFSPPQVDDDINLPHLFPIHHSTTTSQATAFTACHLLCNCHIHFEKLVSSFSLSFDHTMSPFMRRFSRSGSVHREDSKTSAPHQSAPPTSYTPPVSHAPMANGTTGSQHDSRPASSVKSGSSFDFANRPPTNYHQITALPHSAIGNLSRTDQIVLRHFWDVKFEENKSRDLHFVSFHQPAADGSTRKSWD